MYFRFEKCFKAIYFSMHLFVYCCCYYKIDEHIELLNEDKLRHAWE